MCAIQFHLWLEHLYERITRQRFCFNIFFGIFGCPTQRNKLIVIEFQFNAQYKMCKSSVAVQKWWKVVHCIYWNRIIRQDFEKCEHSVEWHRKHK